MKPMTQKILGVALTVIGALLSWALVEILEFKRDWQIDEATEESQQFDNAEQKVKTLKHVETVQPEDVKLIQNDLRHLIDEMHQQSERLNKIEDLNQRTADQTYQTNQRLDTIR